MTNFYKVFYKRCVLVFLFMISAPALAQSGDQDQAFLKPFPNSTLVSSNFAENVVYQVPLGILQRQGGRASPEKSVRVNGALTKLLYEVSSGFDGNDVQAFLKQQFEESGLEPLFACEGRSCGSSNDWANDVFDNRVLYGPAQNQFYMAYAKRSASGDHYFVSYVITRGNGRLYSYIELLETSTTGTDVAGLSESLLRNKFVVLSQLSFAGDAIALDDGRAISDLVSILGLNPDLGLYIVAHLNGPESFDRLQARSQARADSIVAALVAAGIDSARLEAKGVGPLAPRCNGDVCRNRVEAVVR